MARPGDQPPMEEVPRQGHHVVGLVLFALGLSLGFAYMGSYLHDLSGAASYDLRAGAGRARRNEVSAALGRELFNGRGACAACHMVGDEGSGIRGPNLGVKLPGLPQPIAVRAAEAQPGTSAVEHLVQALYEPDAFLAPGFEGGAMMAVHAPPISLDHFQIRSLVLFLFQASGKPANDALAAEILEAQRPWMEGGGPPVADAGPSPLALPAGDAQAGAAAWEGLGCAGCHGAEELPAFALRDERALHLAIASHAGGTAGDPTTDGGARQAAELTVQGISDLVAHLRRGGPDAGAEGE